MSLFSKVSSGSDFYLFGAMKRVLTSRSLSCFFIHVPMVFGMASDRIILEKNSVVVGGVAGKCELTAIYLAV